MNKAQLIGNLGKDAEIIVNGENKIGKFSIATSKSYKNKQGERVTDTEWHNIVCFGKVVDVVEKYFKKGTKLYIEGELKTSSYEKDGVKRYNTDIIMQNFEFVGGANTESTQSQSSNNAPQGDDLPF